jgi:hypothetical protein
MDLISPNTVKCTNKGAKLYHSETYSIAIKLPTMAGRIYRVFLPASEDMPPAEFVLRKRL